MGVTTKDGKWHYGEVVDTHDGFFRVETPAGVKVISKLDVKETDSPVRDAPQPPKK